MMLVCLAGCGTGASAPGGSAAPNSGSAPAPVAGSGLALAISVKSVDSRVLARGAQVEEAVIDVLDPNTLQRIIPTTFVQRDPNQPTQTVRLAVPVGTWLLRIQGRDANGQAAGTRFEQPIVVNLDQVSSVVAVLDPVAVLTTIQVEPGPQAVQSANTTRQYRATGIFSDLSTQDLTTSVTWSSSAAGVAQVDAAGRVQALAAGSTVITAAQGSISGASNLTVTSSEVVALEIFPASLSLGLDESQALTCTAVFADNTRQDLTGQVNWSSSNTTVATVSSTGLVTGKSGGTASVRCSLGDVFAEAPVSVDTARLERLELSPSSPSVPVGNAVQLTATGVYSDGTRRDLSAQATWSSQSPAVATVSPTGLITGVAPGDSLISATTLGVTGSVTARITPATLQELSVTPTQASIPKGSTQQFRAQGRFSDGTTRDLTEEATWTTTAAGVVTISNANGTRGLATGQQAGQAVVEATSEGISAAASVNVTEASLTSLQITPASGSILVSGTLQFSARGVYSDGTTKDVTTEATWSSSNPAAAAVSNAPGSQGLATGLAQSVAAITATLGNLTGTATLTVTVPPPPPPASPTPTPAPNPRLVSYAQTNTSGGDGNSSNQQVVASSADGRYVVFISDATDLVADDTNAATDVFRRDVTTGTTIRVNLTTAGGQSPAGKVGPRAAISNDGQVIAFQTAASLDPGDTGNDDIYVRDVSNGTTIWVSQGGDAGSSNPSISGDGRFVVFQSDATNLLAPGVTNGFTNILMRDLQTSTTTRVSVPDGVAATEPVVTPPDGNSAAPQISNDGAFVAFETEAPNLGGAPANARIVRRDLANNVLALVSNSGFGQMTDPAISANGQIIAYNAGNLDIAVPPRYIFVRDMSNPTAAQASFANAGGDPDAECLAPGISSDGRYITFHSAATNLVATATTGTQVFVLDRTLIGGGGSTALVSQNASSVLGDAISTFGRLSSDGLWVIFTSQASNLEPEASTTGISNVFRYPRPTPPGPVPPPP